MQTPTAASQTNSVGDTASQLLSSSRNHGGAQAPVGGRIVRLKVQAKNIVIAMEKPKRPLSAYNLFFKDERVRLLASPPPHLTLATNRKIGLGDMVRTIGCRWKSIDPETKRRYDVLGQEEKRQYKKKMADWKRMMKVQRLESREARFDEQIDTSTATSPPTTNSNNTATISPVGGGILNHGPSTSHDYCTSNALTSNAAGGTTNGSSSTGARKQSFAVYGRSSSSSFASSSTSTNSTTMTEEHPGASRCARPAPQEMFRNSNKSPSRNVWSEASSIDSEDIFGVTATGNNYSMQSYVPVHDNATVDLGLNCRVSDNAPAPGQEHSNLLLLSMDSSGPLELADTSNIMFQAGGDHVQLLEFETTGAVTMGNGTSASIRQTEASYTKSLQAPLIGDLAQQLDPEAMDYFINLFRS